MPRRMWILKLLLVPVGLYLVALLVIYFAQTSLLFPTRMVGGAGPLPSGSERLQVETPDGERLHGVHILPSQSGGGGGARPLILGFSGNAWNAEDAALYLAQLFPEHNVAAFHYRGYPPSSGSPGAAALLADARLVHDEIVRRLRPSGVVAIGFSIGSGVAARLARERPLEGVILVTPFDSLTGVAARQYPWLPVRLLFRHPMPAAEDMARTRVPAAILAGDRDTLIPPARTEALRARVANLVYDRTIRGAGHNDIYDRVDFRAAMREAKDRVIAR